VIKIPELPGVYQLVTTPVNSVSVEPVRYLIETTPTDVVMVDVPPYSPELADAIVRGGGGGTTNANIKNDEANDEDDDVTSSSTNTKRRSLRAILLTTRNAIHYDQAPAIYSTRRPDLDQWIRAFPGVSIIGYRLDVPRDCRFAMTQILDGYGPFAYSGHDWKNVTFLETGRPLTRSDWNETMREEFRSGRVNPDILEQPLDHDDAAADEDHYSAEAIRKRQDGQSILAIYTPGHTFGAISFVFPKLNVACTGYTVPCEENRETEEETRYDGNVGSNPPGPFLDYRGYVTTSQDTRRQTESAKQFVNTYVDRFTVVLPAYGDPVLLEDDVEKRRETLLLLLEQYRKIGEVYRQMGMVTPEDA
jgi:hypothetical protein